jgi:predicted AAA+ superfamily ATPase
MKGYFNVGRRPRLYFWRDNHGHEVDCVVKKGDSLIAVEIKAGKTINTSFFEELDYWNELTKAESSSSFVIYGGNEPYKWHGIQAFGWKTIADMHGR